MNVEVINTGTELLLGNVVNTHLSYLGQKLFPLGLRISRQVTVPDGLDIRAALVEAFSRADIVLVTGGLGPTTDDVTREVAAELLGLPLFPDLEVRRRIEERLARRGGVLQERMLRQTLVPEGAAVLPNANGTAPGLYLPPSRYEGGMSPPTFLLPGPPRELKPMFEDSALPLLRRVAGDIRAKECRVFRVVGMGESEVEARLGLELSVISELEVGYCARPNEVDLRLIGDPGLLDTLEQKILAVLGVNLVSRSGELLEDMVVHRLRAAQLTLATAESCTGGMIANRITDVPGASEVYLAGWVTYSNAAKIRELGVSEQDLKLHGAVSEPVVRAMAEGALRRAEADFALATTGIAGPGGGSVEKPVGTVFIALAGKNQPTEIRRECFATDRETFKQVTSQTALDMLRRKIF